ncbi:MAG: cytochrome b, partial [Oceanospirillales bacterium]
MSLNKHFLNSKVSYGWINIALHWGMALMILGMYPLGLYIVSLGYYDPGYRIYPNLHRSLGIILAILLLMRLGWRAINPTPRSLAQQPWEKWAAHTAHLLLYVLLMIVLASG